MRLAKARFRRESARFALALAFAGPAALAVLLYAATARAARPFDLGGRDWEGCSELVKLAQDELGPRAVVKLRLDLGELGPQDSLILLHPELSVDDGSLTTFMRAGGRVVLLDDFGTGEGLLARFNLVRIPMPSRPAETLRNNPALAIAEPASEHPIVRDVGRVVLNHATGVSNPNLRPLLRVRAIDEPDVLVAIAGMVGEGRLVVVGDPSIVINSMLRYPGNKAFARNMLRYAADDDAPGFAKRTGHVFILSGAFETRGTYGEDSNALEAWGRAIADAVESMRASGMPAWMMYLASVGIGFGLVLWVGSRAGRVHRPLSPRYTRGIPLAAQGGVAGHAAVVGGERASRLLALLELKSALEEDLAMLAGLDRVPGPDVLVAKVAQAKLLDAEGLHSLRQLLLRLAHVETIMLAQRNDGRWDGGALRRVRDREVVVTAEKVRELLGRAHAAHGAHAHVATGDEGSAA
jgi:hypothetical protein